MRCREGAETAVEAWTFGKPEGFHLSRRRQHVRACTVGSAVHLQILQCFRPLEQVEVVFLCLHALDVALVQQVSIHVVQAASRRKHYYCDDDDKPNLNIDIRFRVLM